MNHGKDIVFRAVVKLGIYVSCFLLFASCRNEKKWDGEIIEQNGVKYILNKSKPYYKTNQFHWKEQLKIGVEDGDSTQTLSFIIDAQADRDGNIYILEKWHILKYDSMGKFLQSIAKPGSGPGELNGPMQLFVNINRKLFVVERNSKRISVFDSNGRFLSTFKVEFPRILDLVADSDDKIYLAAYYQNSRIHKYSINGEYIFSFNEFPDYVNKKNAVFFDGKLAIDDDGQIYWGQSAEYTINVFNNEGLFLKSISVEDANFFVPNFEKMIQYVESNAKIVIMNLHVMDNGAISYQYWNRHTNQFIVDVFNSTGQFLFRDTESIDLNEDPKGYLASHGANDSFFFYRTKPYSFLRKYGLNLPDTKKTNESPVD